MPARAAQARHITARRAHAQAHPHSYSDSLPNSNSNSWAEAIATIDLDGPHVRTLKHDGPAHNPALVLTTVLLNQRVVLKREPLTSALARLRARLGLSRADRHWRAAAALAPANIPTAQCLALLIEHAPATKSGAATWLVMAHVEGPTLLELIARTHSHAHAHAHAPTMPPRAQHQLAADIGHTLARLTACGIANRDAKPSNWIISPTRGPTIIDPVGLRRATNKRTVHMLASLIIEPHGVGTPIRRTLLARALHAYLAAIDTTHPAPRHRFKRLWHRVAVHVAAHLARTGGTPRVSPLPPTQPSTTSP